MEIIGYLKERIREFKSIASNFSKNDNVSPSAKNETVAGLRKEGKDIK